MLYSYVAASPLNHSDPRGLRTVCCQFSHSQKGGETWAEEIDCPEGKTACGCCNRRAAGTFSAWYVRGSVEGECKKTPNDSADCAATIACTAGAIAIPTDPSDAVGTPVGVVVAVCAGIWWVCTPSDTLELPVEVDPPVKPQDGCKPCEPFNGTIAYEIHTTGKPHKGCGLPHTHLFLMSQSPLPACKCFWQRTTIPGNTPPPGIIPFPGPAQGGGPL